MVWTILINFPLGPNDFSPETRSTWPKPVSPTRSAFLINQTTSFGVPYLKSILALCSIISNDPKLFPHPPLKVSEPPSLTSTHLLLSLIFSINPRAAMNSPPYTAGGTTSNQPQINTTQPSLTPDPQAITIFLQINTKRSQFQI